MKKIYLIIVCAVLSLTLNSLAWSQYEYTNISALENKKSEIQALVICLNIENRYITLSESNYLKIQKEKEKLLRKFDKLISKDEKKECKSDFEIAELYASYSQLLDYYTWEVFSHMAASIDLKCNKIRFKYFENIPIEEKLNLITIRNRLMIGFPAPLEFRRTIKL